MRKLNIKKIRYNESINSFINIASNIGVSTAFGTAIAVVLTSVFKKKK